MDRALLVGINKYQFNQGLNGCVNDINAVAGLLTEKCGFAASSIRQLSDDRATRQAILDHLQWLINGISAGDRVVFHYSGHGSRLSGRDPQGEVNGLDEVICPTDFHNGDNAIRDKELHAIFTVVPSGVHFVWIADSCYSGDLGRDLESVRFLPPHNDIAWRIVTARARDLKPLTFRGAAQLLNVAFISGCGPDELAHEIAIGADNFGALTWFLLRRLRESDGLTTKLPQIVADVTTALQQQQFAQNPQLEGAPANTNEAFLAPATAAPARIAALAAVTTPMLSPGDVVFRGKASVYIGEGRFASLVQGETRADA